MGGERAQHPKSETVKIEIDGPLVLGCAVVEKRISAAAEVSVLLAECGVFRRGRLIPAVEG